MSDDPGHEAAEKILQQEQDDSYGDKPRRILPVLEIANWTYCLGCYVRRDHIYDPEMKAWRCEFCGVVNVSMTQRRAAITEVAETYLEENPEEE